MSHVLYHTWAITAQMSHVLYHTWAITVKARQWRKGGQAAITTNKTCHAIWCKGMRDQDNSTHTISCYTRNTCASPHTQHTCVTLHVAYCINCKRSIATHMLHTSRYNIGILQQEIHCYTHAVCHSMPHVASHTACMPLHTASIARDPLLHTCCILRDTAHVFHTTCCTLNQDNNFIPHTPFHTTHTVSYHAHTNSYYSTHTAHDFHTTCLHIESWYPLLHTPFSLHVHIHM
jgi:hypothetical protein